MKRTPTDVDESVATAGDDETDDAESLADDPSSRVAGRRICQTTMPATWTDETNRRGSRLIG